MLNALNIQIILSLTSLILYYYGRTSQGGKLFSTKKWNTGKDFIKPATVLLVLVCIFYLIFKVHYSYTGLILNPHSTKPYYQVTNQYYPYPLHSDEWSHLAQAIFFMEKNGFTAVNPYYAWAKNDLVEGGFLQFGHHAFLAAVYLMTGIEPIFSYRYLAASSACLIALALYFLLKELGYKHYTRIFAMIFFTSIRSNVNVLGFWFYIPSTASFFYILTAIYFLLKSFKDKRMAVLSLIAFSCSLTIHASTTLLGLSCAIIILYNRSKPISGLKSKHIAYSLLLILPFIIFLYIAYSNLGGIEKAIDYGIKRIIFVNEGGIKDYYWNIISFYGNLASMLAIVGGIYAIRKKEGRFFIYWSIIGLIPIIIYGLFGFSILIRQQRAFIFTLIGISVLSARGLTIVLDYAWILSSKIIRNDQGGRIRSFLNVLLVMIIISSIFNGYYTVEKKNYVLYHILEDRHYDAIKHVGETYGGGNIVFTDALASLGLYPISKNYAVDIVSSNLYSRMKSFGGKWLKNDCTYKRWAMKQYNVTLTIVDFKVDCRFLKPVYEKEGLIIYEANFTIKEPRTNG